MRYFILVLAVLIASCAEEKPTSVYDSPEYKAKKMIELEKEYDEVQDEMIEATIRGFSEDYIEGRKEEMQRIRIEMAKLQRESQ